LPYFFFSNIPIIGIKIQLLKNILLVAYNGLALGEGRVFIILFGSARAYHCEGKPGTANRQDRLA
jgi:hypothetical protein